MLEIARDRRPTSDLKAESQQKKLPGVASRNAIDWLSYPASSRSRPVAISTYTNGVARRVEERVRTKRKARRRVKEEGAATAGSDRT